MKIVTRKDKGFVYEHEMTRSKRLGSVANYVLTITFTGLVFTAVVVALINLV